MRVEAQAGAILAALGAWALSGCSGSHLPALDAGYGDVAEPVPDAPPFADAGPRDAADALATLDAGAPSILARYRDYCDRELEALCAGESCCTRVRLGAESCPWLTTEACAVLVESEPGLAAFVDGSVRYRDGAEEWMLAVEAARASCGAWPPGDSVGFLEGDVGLHGDCTPSELRFRSETFRCARGLRCAVTGPSSGGWVGTCEPPGGDGGPCWRHDACLTGFFCRPNDAGSSEACRGRCRPTVPVGAACEADRECQSRLCGGSLTCEDRLASDDWCFEMLASAT